jgi:hypothetical protein
MGFGQPGVVEDLCLAFTIKKPVVSRTRKMSDVARAIWRFDNIPFSCIRILLLSGNLSPEYQ